MSKPDFTPLRAALQSHVDRGLFTGLSWAVLHGRDVVELHAIGLADREAGTPLTDTSLFRIFSNTKLVTSCAVLLLMEEGRLGLDDPVEHHLPQLGRRRVLKPGAQHLDDVEPARQSITVRHLLTHSAGLQYGFFEPGSLLDAAYVQAGLHNPQRSLAEMVEGLATLPLAYHPGQGWAYSLATDVAARLVEVCSGERLGDFFQRRIFGPLQMADTGFTMAPGQAGRLVGYYRGADLLDPFKPGLTRVEPYPFAGAYLQAMPRQSGGGGLVSSLGDMVKLVRSLVPPPAESRHAPHTTTLLRPRTLALLPHNQLPDGQWLRFAQGGAVPGLGHGLVGAVRVQPGQGDGPAQVGELRWGGVAGTQWFISPRHGLAGLLMAQREMAFWHPVAQDFRQHVYRAFGHGA